MASGHVPLNSPVRACPAPIYPQGNYKAFSNGAATHLDITKKHEAHRDELSMLLNELLEYITDEEH